MLKSIFGKKKKTKKPIVIKSGTCGDISYSPIYHNDAISIVHDACVICVDGKKERTVEEKAEFIAGKVKLGHESILEHTNYIVEITMSGDMDIIKAYYEMAHCFKYLNVKLKIYEDDPYFYKYVILIGGSVRGFKHIIRTIENPSNPLYSTIMEYIKYEIPSCFFSDLISDNIFSKEQFNDIYSILDEEDKDIQDVYDYKNLDFRGIINWDETKSYLLYMDDIGKIYDRLCGAYSYYELMDFACINTAFINVSRACSHQLVRHRSGVTQLSQRYVNMKDAIMVLPESIKDNTDVLKTCGDILVKYVDLVNLDNIKKEDARYILPNACSTSLYMTFTYRNLLKAYELRTGKGAQAEIKDLFHSLFDDKLNYISNLSDLTSDALDYIKPYYKFEEIRTTQSLVDDIDFDNIEKSIELDYTKAPSKI